MDEKTAKEIINVQEKYISEQGAKIKQMEIKIKITSRET